MSPCINLYKSLTIEDINDSTEKPKLYALRIAYKYLFSAGKAPDFDSLILLNCTIDVSY
jgi:hypothetical protein